MTSKKKKKDDKDKTKHRPEMRDKVIQLRPIEVKSAA